MRPAQFVTQCVTNRKSLVEQTHVAQVRGIEALTELSRQLTGQRRQQLLAVGGTRLPTLLEFNDMPADFPAGLHLNRIHRTHGLLPGLADQLSQFGEQRLQLGVSIE